MDFLNKMKGFSFSKKIFEETKPSIDIENMKKKLTDEIGGDEDESVIDSILDDISHEMLERASIEDKVQDALLLFSEPDKIENFFKYKKIKTDKINNIQKELENASNDITDEKNDTNDFNNYASDLNIELDRLRKLITVYDINSKSDKIEDDELSKNKELSETPDSFKDAIDTYSKILKDVLSDLKEKVKSGKSDDLLIDKAEDAITNAGLTVININVGDKETTPDKEIKNIRKESNAGVAEDIKMHKKFIKDILTGLQSALLPESTNNTISKDGDFFNIFNKIGSNSNYSDLQERINDANNLKFGETNEFIKDENPDIKYQLLYLESINAVLNSLIDSNVKDARENKKWKNSLEKIYLDRQAYIKNKNLSRKINMSDFAGLSIKREVKIPLYKTVNIPISDEDIIANSFMSKVKNAFSNIKGITGWQKSYVDQGAAQANNKQNKAIIKGIASIITGTAGMVGGKKARESTNLTMKKVGNVLGTEIKDSGVKEDMVMPIGGSGGEGSMPGLLFDTPQSVPGGMDTFAKLGPGGTGKKRNKKKKKKKNKKKVYNKNKSKVFTFKEFLDR